MLMSDTDKNKVEHRESEAEKIQPEQIRENEAGVETTISIEGVIEGIEESSGEVKEGEKAGREGYTGGKAAKQAAISARLPKLPSLKQMRAQVEDELKKQIKEMHNKINHVMKKRGNFEADKLNELVARLRHLKDLLSSLARATADAIKELWRKYVHAKKTE